MNPPYRYNATLDRVVDGDTVDLWVDLGFRIKTHQRFRLSDIDAPERFTDLGKVATETLTNILKDRELSVESKKVGKYGRWVGKIWTDDSPTDVSTRMVEVGLAEFKEY